MQESFYVLTFEFYGDIGKRFHGIFYHFSDAMESARLLESSVRGHKELEWLTEPSGKKFSKAKEGTWRIELESPR